MTDFKVHSRHDTTVPVKAKMEDGTEVDGQMPCAIIELVPASGEGRSITIERRLGTDELKAGVDAVFQVGATVRLGEFTFINASEV